jgi:oligopeptide transport system ATP-binding protein
MQIPILSVRDLSTHFETAAGVVKAVNDVSFDLMQGETLGIVGESGSGKTVLSLSILGLVPSPPGRIVKGEIMLTLDGVTRDLVRLKERELRDVRGNSVAMIFQDPMTSLNPVYKVGDQVSEPLRIHAGLGRKEAWAAAVELLRRVGIANPGRRAKEYPHEFSGGMRQRAMIAMAVANNPRILIADEPTTALDVTIQAQILELMQAMRSDFGSAIMLITHDLGVVAGMADRVLVMYGGRIVESGTVDEVYYSPQHPYTWGLLGSVPRLDSRGDHHLVTIPGQPPNLLNMDDHRCPFAHRCKWVNDRCLQGFPAYDELSRTHRVACTLERGRRQQIARVELAGDQAAAGGRPS